MKEKKTVHVATFGKPQGLKGEIKINILTSSLDSFKKLNTYFIENPKRELTFKSLRTFGKKFIASIPDCNDRDQSLEYRGVKIYSYRNKFPTTKDGEHYIFDLIDCKVFNKEKNIIGSVVDIKNFGAGDLMEIKKETEKSFFIPMDKDNLISIDVGEKIIIVNPILGLLE